MGRFPGFFTQGHIGTVYDTQRLAMKSILVIDDNPEVRQAIPFILMTGSMGPNNFRRGMASGADDYLMKPFTPGELIATVKSHFARQTHLQADMAYQVENCPLEEFRELSKELTAPIHGLLSAVAARLRHKPATEEATVPAADSHQAVYCLD